MTRATAVTCMKPLLQRGCVRVCDTCGEAEIVVDGCIINAGDEDAGAREKTSAREIHGYAGASDVGK